MTTGTRRMIPAIDPERLLPAGDSRVTTIIKFTMHRESVKWRQ